MGTRPDGAHSPDMPSNPMKSIILRAMLAGALTLAASAASAQGVPQIGMTPSDIPLTRGPSPDRLMVVDDPEVKAEVEAAFKTYEAALVANDVPVLEALFRDDPRTIRYGAGENLYGMDAIRAFRRGRSPAGLARALSQTVITTYGRDFATAMTLFVRESAPGRIGRQSQTWVRFPDGWRVVAAHVSLIDG